MKWAVCVQGAIKISIASVTYTTVTNVSVLEAESKIKVPADLHSVHYLQMTAFSLCPF